MIASVPIPFSVSPTEPLSYPAGERTTRHSTLPKNNAHRLSCSNITQSIEIVARVRSVSRPITKPAGVYKSSVIPGPGFGRERVMVTFLQWDWK